MMTESEGLPELTEDEMARYARHLTLPEVGVEGQQKLKAARVLCVGTGGLGSPLLLYLAAAGVGTLGLVDFDVVDASNLQRQILYSTADLGRKKVDSAAEKLVALNPALKVVKHDTMLSSANALEIFKDYDIIADGTDNFPTRYLVNDACVLSGKPNVYWSIFRFAGDIAGSGGRVSGVGGNQADFGQGDVAGGPAAAGGFAGDAVPGDEGEEESGVPGVRDEPDGDQAD